MVSNNMNMVSGDEIINSPTLCSSGATKISCEYCHKMISIRNISTHHKTCKVKKTNEHYQYMNNLLENSKRMEHDIELLKSSLDNHKVMLAEKDMQISILQKTLDDLLKNIVIIKKENGHLEIS